MDLLATGHRTGYLLKSRVTDVAEFIETLKRVVRGGSAVDPALVQELVAARRTDDPLDVLTAREREVLALMAEGPSRAMAMARRMWMMLRSSLCCRTDANKASAWRVWMLQGYIVGLPPLTGSAVPALAGPYITSLPAPGRRSIEGSVSLGMEGRHHRPWGLAGIRDPRGRALDQGGCFLGL